MDFTKCREETWNCLARVDEELRDITGGFELLKNQKLDKQMITGSTKSGKLFSITFTLNEPGGEPIKAVLDLIVRHNLDIYLAKTA